MQWIWSAAFRILCLKRKNFCWLVMKAKDPKTGQTYYFVDKCLPFGASISCALFQAFSDALQHITQYRINRNSLRTISNYLDDFLFVALTVMHCNEQVVIFLQICNDIGCPVSDEKTEWGCTIIVFLGILLDGHNHLLCVPVDKKDRALAMLRTFIDSKKVTIKQIRVLTGLLNFLTRAIVPGRAFTRRMYAKITTTDKYGNALQDHHHVRLDMEFKNDSLVWINS